MFNYFGCIKKSWAGSEAHTVLEIEILCVYAFELYAKSVTLGHWS